MREASVPEPEPRDAELEARDTESDLDLELPEQADMEPLPVDEVSVEAPAADDEPLLSLDEAVARIPEELRHQMEDLLRAEFREVQRWKAPKS